MTDKEKFERALLKYGISRACAYFNHLPLGGFAHNLFGVLKEKYKLQGVLEEYRTDIVAPTEDEIFNSICWACKIRVLNPTNVARWEHEGGIRLDAFKRPWCQKFSKGVEAPMKWS